MTVLLWYALGGGYMIGLPCEIVDERPVLWTYERMLEMTGVKWQRSDLQPLSAK